MSSLNNIQRKRIVILGGGFAGAYCAQELEKRLKPDAAEVLLIDKRNYFVFSPLLVEAGTGNLEPRHAVVSLRSFLRKTQFRMGTVESVDLKSRHVCYRLGEDLSAEDVAYDHLVFAVGSATRLPNIPGLKEHGFEMKSLTDAVALRDRAIRLLELADSCEDSERRRMLLHFVVVGGGFTGTEVAGEFDVLLHDAAKAYHNIRSDDCRVTLIERAGRILEVLDEDLSAFAAEKMRKRKIDIRLNTSVQAVEPEQVILSTGEALNTSTLIWCAGIQPPRLFETLDVPKTKQGFVQCGSDMRVSGHENLWAIGDCAAIPDPTGKHYAQTAQLAIKQGKLLAMNIDWSLRGLPLQKCDFKDAGNIAPLGCRTGVAKVFGIKLAGMPAWILWRTVYLLKMPGFFRKVRVAMDWTMDLLFRREYVQVGVHQRETNVS